MNEGWTGNVGEPSLRCDYCETSVWGNTREQLEQAKAKHRETCPLVADESSTHP